MWIGVTATCALTRRARVTSLGGRVAPVLSRSPEEPSIANLRVSTIAALPLLALAGIGSGLLIAEGVLALLAPQIHRLPDVWAADAHLGWRHIPGASGHLVNPEFDVEYRIDELGRRQHLHAGEPTSGSRIQLFGDSFAEGWGVDVERGLAAQLEAELTTRSPSVTVANYGVAGYGTDQELLLFEAQGAARDPDLVLVLFYGNDLWNNASRWGIGAERGPKPYFRVGADGALQLLGVPVPVPAPREPGRVQYLAERWHVVALARKASLPEAIGQAQKGEFYAALYGRDEERYAPLWTLAERLLAAFAERARRAGARFAVVYAPAIVQVEVDDWRTKRDLHGLTGDFDLMAPNRMLGQIAGRQGIPYLDLCPDFVGAAAGATLFYRDSHWTAAGHALAARVLAQFVAQRGLLPAETP